jgi:hypothetical protein
MRAIARDQVGDLIETTRVIRKTVQEHDRPPGWIALPLVADLHPAADDRAMFHRHVWHVTGSA